MFYGDLYHNSECYNESRARSLKSLVEARRDFAYGPRVNYFAERNYIGFLRQGDSTHNGCAVLISNAAKYVPNFLREQEKISDGYPGVNRAESEHHIKMNVGQVSSLPNFKCASCTHRCIAICRSALPFLLELF